MTTTTTTKICSQCKRELPLEQFQLSNGRIRSICPECYSQNLKAGHLAAKNKKAKGTNPELQKFFAIELIQELRARGYKGELQYVQTIKI